MRTLIFFGLYFCFSTPLFSQSDTSRHWHIQKSVWDTIHGISRLKIDTLLGDTAKWSTYSDRYFEITKNGVVLVEGHYKGGMGSRCGCVMKKHGIWVYRYRSGGLKEIGSYDCRLGKTGTWTYYYENGQLRKVETYATPYLESFVKLEVEKLRHFMTLSGPYLEYYENGQIKVDGYYTIMEAYSEVDTIYHVDLETYELIPEVVFGEFWIPKSVPTGIWHTYAKDGTLLEEKRIGTPKSQNGNSLRSVDARYFELLSKIIETQKKAENSEEIQKE